VALLEERRRERFSEREGTESKAFTAGEGEKGGGLAVAFDGRHVLRGEAAKVWLAGRRQQAESRESAERQCTFTPHLSQNTQKMGGGGGGRGGAAEGGKKSVWDRLTKHKKGQAPPAGTSGQQARLQVGLCCSSVV
jgi:hypothetical protein